MPYIRLIYRSPIVSNQTVFHRVRRRVPQNLSPVLQPSIIPIQSDFIIQEKQQRQIPRKIHSQSSVNDSTYSREITEQIPIVLPTYILQQNYPTRPYRRPLTHSIRYAIPKYSPLLYPIQ